MKIIGLTGQTGSGKSHVAFMLRDYGFFHIDADVVAKDVIDSNDELKARLTKEFGRVINADGSVNRKALAKAAFKDLSTTELLNSIVDDAVIKRINEIIEDKKAKGYRGVVIDAIALFESGANGVCDFTISVIAPKDERLKRILKRDKITKEEAINRINAQKDQEFFTEKSDFVVRNYPPYDLKSELLPIINSL